MLFVDGARYWLQEQTDEERLESMIKEHSKEIFGETSEYFDLKHKLTSKAGLGSIPDAYVVDFRQPYKWFIVEVELAAHSTDQHIMPQLNKILRGIARAESQNVVSNAMFNEIEKNEKLKTFVKTKIGSSEIHRVLSEIVSSPPSIAVVIDEATEEVLEPIEDFKKQPIVIEFKTYVREDAEKQHIHMFDPVNLKKTESQARISSPDLEQKIAFFRLALEELRLKAPQITNARVGHSPRHAWVEIKTQKRYVAFYFGEENRTIYVDLYIYMGSKINSQTVFDFFFRRKDEIEKLVGTPITWEKTHPRYSKASRIIIRNSDYTNCLIWESKQAITWGVDNLIKLYQALSPQLSNILK